MNPGHFNRNGIALWYAVTGEGPPIVLLHGGLANSNYWGNQVDALRTRRTVIVMDSRGQGRSQRDAQPFGYDLMADDVAAILSHLQVPCADIVGWSDGAIIGLDLAIRRPERVGKLLAFAGNTRTDGMLPHMGSTPVFAAFLARAAREYAALSPTPADYALLVAQISRMWQTQPNWTDNRLQTIRAPVLVVSGDHDEAIRRSHTEQIAATIPGAELSILPDTSHFAFLQNPDLFNATMLRFLEDG